MYIIDNPQLNSFETTVLKRLLSPYLLFSKTVAQQINNATIEREQTAYYCRTLFKSIEGARKADISVRVPIELHIFRPPNKPLMIALLHIIKGRVSELEIFNADSSEIDYDVLDNPFEVVLRA